ncbi:hypothetical protein Tco_0291999 [Tanacetum coccineum]
MMNGNPTSANIKANAEHLTGKTTGLDKLRLSKAQIVWGMFYQKNIDYVELLWEDFTYQIDNKDFKKQEKMYYPRFTKVSSATSDSRKVNLPGEQNWVQPSKPDDYLINTLRFVSRKEASQKYGVVLPECLTSPAMKESKAYKTYIGFAIGVVPPKSARKFKKASPSKKDNVPIPEDKEHVKKGKRLKTTAKNSAEAQMKEVHKKSLRDFHKTHPSGSGTVAKDPPSVTKITPPVISKGTGDYKRVPCDNDAHLKQEKNMKDDDQKRVKMMMIWIESHDETGVSVIPESSLVFTNFPQSSQTLTPTPILETPTPPLIIETSNPLANLPDFSSVFRFNDRISALEKEVAKLKKDPLHTQVVTPPKSGSNGMVTMGCYVKVQQSRYRKRP